MKVTLLRQVGDHLEGDELDIKDRTVLAAWAKMKVIDPETVADFLSEEEIKNAPDERESESVDLTPVGGEDAGAGVVKSTGKPKKQ